MIPQLSQGEFTVKMRLPAGSPLETTDRQVKFIHNAASALPNLESAYSVAGTGNRLDANPVDSGENTGNLDVKLRAPIDKEGEEAAMQQLRTRLAGIPGAQYEFARPSLLTLATPVEVILAGYDLERLDVAASAVRTRMEASGAFKDIRSSIEGGHPEIQILFDQERASQLGLAVRDIADRVVSNVRGNVATRYRLQEKKIDVLVRSVDTRAASIDEVRNLVVNPGSDRPVPLSAVAEVRLATGPAEIRRANQERVAVISAAPVSGDLGDATATRTGDPRPNYFAGRHHGHGVRPERGNDAEFPFAGPRLRAGGIPRLPRDGLAVRIAAAPVRHPVHDSDGAHRLGVGVVHHRHHHQFGGAHRPHHAGRHRGEQRHRVDRCDQPGARTRP